MFLPNCIEIRVIDLTFHFTWSVSLFIPELLLGGEKQLRLSALFKDATPNMVAQTGL